MLYQIEKEFLVKFERAWILTPYLRKGHNKKTDTHVLLNSFEQQVGQLRTCQMQSRKRRKIGAASVKMEPLGCVRRCEQRFEKACPADIHSRCMRASNLQNHYSLSHLYVSLDSMTQWSKTPLLSSQSFCMMIKSLVVLLPLEMARTWHEKKGKKVRCCQ